MSRAAGRVAVISRYPVKSLQGEAVPEVVPDTHGIAGDRRHALRYLATGKIVSAQLPRLGIPLLTCRAATGPDGQITITVGEQTWPVEACDVALSELLGRPVRMEQGTGADEVYESEWPEIAGLALCGITTDLPVAMGTEKGTIAARDRIDFAGFGMFACLGVYAEVSAPVLVRVGDELVLD
jgi:hypothetical protein